MWVQRDCSATNISPQCIVTSSRNSIYAYICLHIWFYKLVNNQLYSNFCFCWPALFAAKRIVEEFECRDSKSKAEFMRAISVKFQHLKGKNGEMLKRGKYQSNTIICSIWPILFSRILCSFPITIVKFQHLKTHNREKLQKCMRTISVKYCQIPTFEGCTQRRKAV